MDQPPQKLRHEAREQTSQEQQSVSGQHAIREYGSVEELLRHDAEQVAMPAHLAAKVQDSIAHEPGARRGWWQRLLGR